MSEPGETPSDVELILGEKPTVEAIDNLRKRLNEDQEATVRGLLHELEQKKFDLVVDRSKVEQAQQDASKFAKAFFTFLKDSLPDIQTKLKLTSGQQENIKTMLSLFDQEIKPEVHGNFLPTGEPYIGLLYELEEQNSLE